MGSLEALSTLEGALAFAMLCALWWAMRPLRDRYGSALRAFFGAQALVVASNVTISVLHAWSPVVSCVVRAVQILALAQVLRLFWLRDGSHAEHGPRNG